MKHTTDIEEAGCAHFESTLGLMDGTLAGAARTQAEQHAASCPLCGPMIAGWKPLNAALVHHFEDKAELAKPQLAQMSNRVFAAIDGPAKAKTADSWFARLAARLHVSQRQFGFVAAAAAVAVVLVPLARTGTIGTPDPSPSPTAQPGANDEQSDAFRVNELAFDGASGTVYTADDGTPVIWVTESDGA